MTQVEQAELFQELHLAPEVLVLPNAWDAGSAVIFEKTGFMAIGSTSAGIAYSLGYPDSRVPFEEVLAAVTRIIRRIEVPFSVDIETGFGTAIEQKGNTVEQVVSAGAVGINLEDGFTDGGPHLADLQAQCESLMAIEQVKKRTGVPFVINARTDSFWLDLGSPAEQLQASVERGNAYLEAGADCVFVPGNMKRETIATLAKELNGPLNVIAGPSCPPIQELTDLGVARVSLGSGPARAALDVVQRIAREVKQGSLASLAAASMGYDEANLMFDF